MHFFHQMEVLLRICMWICRLNWICKLIKKSRGNIWKEVCGIRLLIFLHRPLPLSQGLDECPKYPTHPTPPKALDPLMGSADQSTSSPWFLFFQCPGARAFLAFLPFLELFAVDWLFSTFSFAHFLNSLHYSNIVPYLSWTQKCYSPSTYSSVAATGQKHCCFLDTKGLS